MKQANHNAELPVEEKKKRMRGEGCSPPGEGTPCVEVRWGLALEFSRVPLACGWSWGALRLGRGPRAWGKSPW